MTCSKAKVNKSNSPLIIAMDGYSSCGKSTIAKDLAAEIDYLYIDTGAMYRAVTLLLLENEVELSDEKAISSLLKDLELEFRKMNGQRELFMNGINVEKEIRTPRIAAFVSPVSEISIIRKRLVEIQRKMAQLGEGVILEGRDIGTVVFPNADLKFFITADLDKRAERRYLELIEKGMSISLEEVRQNLSERDKIDSSRADSPLKRAEDAMLIDTTEHSRESQLQVILDIYKQHMAKR
jgi:cytidylate kinase